MSISLELKNKIKKRIRKYMTVVCSLLVIPLLNFNAFAFNINDVAVIGYINAYHLTTVSNNDRSMLISAYSGTSSLYSKSIAFSSVDNVYYCDNDKLSNVTQIRLGTASTSFDFVYSPNLYDYYVYIRVHSDNQDTTFMPNRILTRDYSGSSSVAYDLTDLVVFNHRDTSNTGFSLCAKIPFLDTSAINVFDIYSNSSVLGADIAVEGVIFAFDKNSQQTASSIVSAIYNQTSTLGGKLDGIDSGIDKGNDLIENGNSGTESTITDFNEVFDDFNAELDNLESFDDEIIGEFNSANETYMTELNNFNLSTSLLQAGNWLSTSMQTIYDGSSDYKMLWHVPLLFGIPILIFVVKRSGDDE